MVENNRFGLNTPVALIIDVEPVSGIYAVVCFDATLKCELVRTRVRTEAEVINIVRKLNATPVNFGINAYNNELLFWSSLDRLKGKNAFIVVARVATSTNETQGYFIFVKNTLRMSFVLAKELEGYFNQGNIICHNAMFRNKAITCYPDHPFPIYIKPTAKAVKREVSKPSVSASVLMKDTQTSEYNDKQQSVLSSARKANALFPELLNNSLSAEQMAKAVEIKKAGGPAEYVTSAGHTPEQMAKLADGIKNTTNTDDTLGMVQLASIEGITDEQLDAVLDCMYDGKIRPWIYNAVLDGMSGAEIKEMYDELEEESIWSRVNEHTVDSMLSSGYASMNGILQELTDATARVLNLNIK